MAVLAIHVEQKVITRTVSLRGEHGRQHIASIFTRFTVFTAVLSLLGQFFYREKSK